MSPKVSIRLLPSQTDGRLVELAGHGHERAFEALVHRYRRPLLRYCRRMGLSDARSEDVLQHSLTKAWLALSQGKEVREPRPWLYRIVHNDAVNSVRRAPVEQVRLSDALVSAASSERSLEGRIEAREALAQVASLPQMQRHAIVLTAIEGRSHREAADALGISDGAVRGLLHRARTTLRSAAAAVFSPVLLRWPGRWVGTGSLGERTTELSLGGGAVGASGVLLKGAALTATIGLLAAGTDAVHHGSPTGHVRGARAHTRAGVDHAASALQAAPHVPATGELALVESKGRTRGHTDGERRGARPGRRRGDGGSAAPPVSPADSAVEQPPTIQPAASQEGAGQDGADDERASLDRGRGERGDQHHSAREGGGVGGVEEDRGGGQDGRAEEGHDSVAGSLGQAGDVGRRGSSSIEGVGLTPDSGGSEGPGPSSDGGGRGGMLGGSSGPSGGDGADHEGGQGSSSDGSWASSDGSGREG